MTSILAHTLKPKFGVRLLDHDAHRFRGGLAERPTDLEAVIAGEHRPVNGLVRIGHRKRFAIDVPHDLAYMRLDRRPQRQAVESPAAPGG